VAKPKIVTQDSVNDFDCNLLARVDTNRVRRRLPDMQLPGSRVRRTVMKGQHLAQMEPPEQQVRTSS